jgi:cytochrome P450
MGEMETLHPKVALPQLRGLRDDPLSTLLAWGRLAPRLYLPVPGFPLALVFDPEGVEQILLTDGLSKRTFQYGSLRRLTGQGLLTDDGASWRIARKALKDPFLPRTVQGYRPLFEAESEAFFAAWQEGDKDLDHEMLALSLRLLGRPLFGAPLPERLAELTLVALDHLMARTRSPLAWLDPMAETRFRRVKRALYDAAESLIVHAPLSALPRERALSEAVTLLVAGHETVASALTWSLYLLSRHPEHLDPLAADEAYALNVFHETLRLYPPAWIVTRRLEREFVLGDHPLPKGTTVVLSPYVTHRLAFDDGESFRPERFRSESPTPSGRYFPFGLGQRLCLGRDFALLEGPIVLRHLFRRFRLGPISPPSVLAQVTLRPRSGLWARVHAVTEVNA